VCELDFDVVEGQIADVLMVGSKRGNATRLLLLRLGERSILRLLEYGSRETCRDLPLHPNHHPLCLRPRLGQVVAAFVSADRQVLWCVS
jgi:hypothetical protein